MKQLSTNHKFPLALLLIFLNCLVLHGQTNKKIGLIDTFVSRIENDSQLIKKELHLDTTYADRSFKNQDVRIRYNEYFTTFSDPGNGKVEKIVWHPHRHFNGEMTFYFHRKEIIKMNALGNYSQTDTNPKFETNAVAYFEKTKIIYTHESIPNTHETNWSWVLSTMYKIIEITEIPLN